MRCQKLIVRQEFGASGWRSGARALESVELRGTRRRCAIVGYASRSTTTAARVVDLRDQAASASVGASPSQNAPVDGCRREQFLDRTRSPSDPVPRSSARARPAARRIRFPDMQHARVVERMDVARDRQRERANASAVARLGRQQPMSPAYISSRYSMIASDWRITRSPSTRVGTSSCGLTALISAACCSPPSPRGDRHDLVGEALQVERDAHAVRRARTPVAVELEPLRPWSPLMSA